MKFLTEHKLDKQRIYSYHFINFKFDKNIMAEHRPQDTLLSLIEQSLLDHPEGLAPRDILERLHQKGEDISRPSLNRLLTQGIEQGRWTALGGGRNIVYILGTTASATSSPSMDTSMKKATKKEKTAASSTTAPQDVHTQIRAMVWAIADTLRDKTQLQVEGYQPVTLALLALKRNMDIQAEALAKGGQYFDKMSSEIPLINSGLRDPKDVALAFNNLYGFWNSSLISGDKFGLPMMTWDDLVNFKDSDTAGERTTPYKIEMRSNPIWTYSTKAPDLKALILEIVEHLTPDLKEAFGAFGIHTVLHTNGHSATLSNTILREICHGVGDANGNTKTSKLAEFDLSLKNVSMDVFSDTYMDLLGRFAEDSGKKGGEYFTPTPLIDKTLQFAHLETFAQKLSDDPSYIFSMGDPTAGSNTFVIRTYEIIMRIARDSSWRQPQKNQFALFTQELKTTQVGLGLVNMFYHGLASRLNLTPAEIQVGRRLDQGGGVGRGTGNTITEYTNNIGKQSNSLDFVGANPPYGTDDYGITYATTAPIEKDKRWTAGVPTRSEGEWAFIQTIVDLLSPTGRATVILPLGVLFRDGGQNFRQWLIEKDWIEAVVSTPSNQFLTTSIPVCILVLNKNKTQSLNGVYFINASNDFTKQGKFNHWDDGKSIAAWQTREEIPYYSGFISADKLKKNKYSLAVNRYFAPPKAKIDHNPMLLNQELLVLQQDNAARQQWLFGEDGVSGVFGQAQAAWAETQGVLKDQDNTTGDEP